MLIDIGQYKIRDWKKSDAPSIAIPYATNTASVRVLEKAGFFLEGTLRANVYKDGRVLDQFLYARVRENL